MCRESRVESCDQVPDRRLASGVMARWLRFQKYIFPLFLLPYPVLSVLCRFYICSSAISIYITNVLYTSDFDANVCRGINIRSPVSSATVIFCMRNQTAF
jgi:hypothetical protein